MKLCKKCRDKLNREAMARKNARKAKCVCPHCGKKAERGYVACSACRKKNRASCNSRYRRRIAEGKCGWCGKKKTGKCENRPLCLRCMKKRRRRESGKKGYKPYHRGGRGTVPLEMRRS